MEINGEKIQYFQKNKNRKLIGHKSNIKKSINFKR